jgi:hypothetical protein
MKTDAQLKQDVNAELKWEPSVHAAEIGVEVKDDQVIKYETALKVDKYVLMVHGNAEEVAQARSVLVDAVIAA